MPSSAPLGLCLAVLMIGGCSQVSGSVTPGVSLSQLRSFYIVRDKQSDATDAMQKALAARGYVATTGPEASIPAGTDCKVLVRDHWMWDITMYLLELQVDIINPKTGALYAQGRSYHPSLERKDAETMANEIAEKIFGPTAKQ
jgi:hypothetical protein